MPGTNCCNSIMWRLMLCIDLDSVIDEFQTGVMSTTCYSPTDVIIEWMLIVWAGFFIRTSFFLVDMDVRTVGHSVGFRCGYCKYFFRQWTKMMLTSLGEYFSATVLNGRVLHGNLASVSSGTWRFSSTNISQDSVATRLSCGGIFNCALREIYSKSAGERI